MCLFFQQVPAAYIVRARLGLIFLKAVLKLPRTAHWGGPAYLEGRTRCKLGLSSASRRNPGIFGLQQST